MSTAACAAVVCIGWSPGLIYIKRSLRHGVPSYTDADELELVGIGGGGRLVPDGTLAGRYWVEGQGKTVKVDRQGNLFIVTDGTGTVYVPGGTPGSKQGDAARTSASATSKCTRSASFFARTSSPTARPSRATRPTRS